MSKNVRPNRRREPRVRQIDRQGWKSLGVGALKVGLACTLALGLPYGTYLAYRHLADDGYFHPQNITIHGNVRASDAQILEVSGLETEEANLFEMDVRTIEAGVETLPWVKDARVRISLPDSVSIEVTEHEPLGIVHDGALTIVDGEGNFIKHWSDSDDDALTTPIVSLDRPLEERAREVVRAFEYAEAIHKRGYPHKIHEIHYDAATGYSLYTRTTEIRMGYDRFDERIERLMAVDAELNARHVVADYILVDADDALDRIVVKPKIAAVPPEAPPAPQAVPDAGPAEEAKSAEKSGSAKRTGVTDSVKIAPRDEKSIITPPAVGEAEAERPKTDKSAMDDDAALPPLILE